MFKNNSYTQEPYNYSFQDEDDLINNKQNNPTISNKMPAYSSNEDIFQKLHKIQSMISKQYLLEQQNRQMLLIQSQQISRIDKKLSKLMDAMNYKQQESVRDQGAPKAHRTECQKSESTKSCRNRKSAQKSMLNSLQVRQKAINQQIHKRLTSQLSHSKPEKKPLKFFMQQQ